MRYFCKRATKEYSSGAYVQAVGVHQHTLQAFKNTIYAEMWTKICLKMLYFLEKAGKFVAALGAPPPNPVGLRRTPKLLFPLNLCVILSTAVRNFLDFVKISTFSGPIS